jgi:hypothetical protein
VQNNEKRSRISPLLFSPNPFLYVADFVLQISTLINHHNECTTAVGMGVGSARALRAVARVGQAVNLAVDRFVTVGETIADDNPEIRDDMYDSCKEARSAGEQFSPYLTTP